MSFLVIRSDKIRSDLVRSGQIRSGQTRSDQGRSLWADVWTTLESVALLAQATSSAAPLRRDALPVSRDLRDRRCLEAPCRPKKEE